MPRKKKRPFKISLTKTKDGMRIDFEGEDPITTAFLSNIFQLMREGTKKLVQKIENISREFPKK